jgi:MFS family permease
MKTEWAEEGSPRPGDESPRKPFPPSHNGLIYCMVTLYALAFMSQQPTKLFWVKTVTESKGDAEQSYATFTSFLALLQLVGSLFSGALVDRWGAKKVMLLSLGASTLVYALTANASTLLGLFLAGLPSVLQHAMLAARSYLTATLDNSLHATALGRLAIAYGVGMVLGPYLGGLLAAQSLALAALAAAALSLATALMIWVGLPEARVEDRAEGSGSGSSSSAPGATEKRVTYLALLALPGIQPALLLKTAFFLSSQLFQSVLTLLAVERFALGPEGMGTVLSLVGASSALANLLPPLLAGVPLGTTLIASSLACAASIFAVGLLPPTATLGVYLLCVPQAMSGALFATMQSTQMTVMVPPTLQGSLSAFDMAARYTVGIFTPFFAQALLTHAGHFAASALPAAIMAGVAAAATLF